MTRSRREGRPPGIYDVAHLAGVSHQTVSRVLNDVPNVRPETRLKVIDAIATLGYRRNNLARALATRRSGTLGVVTSGSTLWGPSSALVGIERAAREAGYFLSLAGVGPDPLALVDALTHFRNQLVEGIIVIAPEVAWEHVAAPLVADVPMVLVWANDTPPDGIRITSVDQALGARRITRLLLDLGHRRIAHVAGPLDWFDAQERVRGWRAELDSVGLPAVSPAAGDWTARSGYTVGLQLRELITAHDPDAPTAVFAANDLMAIGLIRAFQEVGLRVPQDVSVVGFDDMPGSELLYPSLTTVRQDFQALGRQCLAILLAAIAGQPVTPGRIPPTLVTRESAGPPPQWSSATITGR